MITFSSFPSPHEGEGAPLGADEGAAKSKHLTQINHTPHPAVGHLLPQGEKGSNGN